MSDQADKPSRLRRRRKWRRIVLPLVLLGLYGCARWFVVAHQDVLMGDAIATDSVGAVRCLLALGADVDPPLEQPGDVPPLQLAVAFGHREIAELLVKRGADPNRSGRLPGTPLYRSALYAHPGIFRLLMEHGADPWAPTPDGGTLLHAAAYGGSTALIDQLLDMGMRPDAVDSGGNTPLHCAARFGRERAAWVLLDARADPRHLNSIGSSPADVAEENRHTALAQQLRERMAK